MPHTHNFKSWTFSEPVNTGTFTTRPVIEGSQPVLEVYHNADGAWQFLCGTTVEFDDLKLVCLGCIVERDETLLEIADLPASWRAFRKSSMSPWQREEFEDDE